MDTSSLDGIWRLSRTTMAAPESTCEITVADGAFVFTYRPPEDARKVLAKGRFRAEVVGTRLMLTSDHGALTITAEILPEGELEFPNPDGTRSWFRRDS